VPTRLPLFPLGLVLVPGQPLPLHVFEERYRLMVRDLLAGDAASPELGVIAIRSGREVGADGVLALHDVGCTARLEQVREHPDGRFDLVATGGQPFRLLDVDHGAAYLTGLVDLLGDRVGPAHEAALLAEAVGPAFADYLRALAAAGGGRLEDVDLPTDPRALSHLVTVGMRVDLEDRQALLAEPDAVSRLRAGLALLRRESQLMRLLSAVPVPELARQPLSPN
jgi:Lon protease-like protein